MRILVDAWLSGYAVGDLMERTIQVQLDPSKIETIDAVYVSHSHTDHFDVYTLTQIFSQGNKKPLLLLPATLAYLVPLIREYLGDIPLQILYPSESFFLK